MAGHSKWKNIRFRKDAQDARRGKLFTKFIREITVAARMGGAELANNPRLRAVIDKAFTANMTRETVERAIKRGIGGDDDAALMEIRYEGYGPNGVAVIIETMTDNRNRTVSEVRHALTKSGGQLGTDGSVVYLFNKRGELVFSPGCDENAIMELALEYGADDVMTDEDGSVTVLTSLESFMLLKEALEAKGFKAEEADINWHASVRNTLDKDTAEKVLKLVDMLEDLDDVQHVYTNADISDDILSAIYGS
jgi:YebC/PmpR family DNA-binding regulatory protein